MHPNLHNNKYNNHEQNGDSPLDSIHTTHLENNIEGQKKKQQELTGKSEYLEKRLKSQQMNMKELTQQ